MPGIRIRRANDDDLPEIEEMDRVLFCHGEPPLRPEGLAFWVAEVPGGAVLGYAAARLSVNWADAVYLARVGVAPEWRGHRLQRRFIRVREAWARRMGARWCVTDTAPDNAASTNSLIHCGYRMIVPGENRKWGGNGATYWARRLTPG